MKGDDTNGHGDAVEYAAHDDHSTIGLVRRYEQSIVDIDQRLKDIVTILRDMRGDLTTERDRTDQLERDMVEHRKYVDELGQRRKAAAKKVK